MFARLRQVLVGLVVLAAFGAIGFGVWSQWPGRVKVIVKGCPGVIVGQRGVAEWTGAIVHEGRLYAEKLTEDSGESTVKFGRELTTIRCSITEIESGTGLVAEKPPWPDRTATIMPSGTVVREVVDRDPACWLGTSARGVTTTYQAVDPQTWQPLPSCR